MKSLPIKIVGSLLAATIALGFWILFAPTKLGGSSTYSVTSGISMEPLLHKGDLAFVRVQPSYRVGDIVLYQSQVLHRPVLHRIILIQHGKYFFQGDNNNFVDPGYATKRDLTGTMWLSVPSVGGMLSWFGAPSHAALLAGAAGMLLVLATQTTKKRRRRRRGGSPTMTTARTPAAEATPAPPPVSWTSEAPVEAPESGERARVGNAGKRRPPPYLDGPVSTLIALGVVIALAALCLVVGFSRPSTRPGVQANAYQQAGTFAYSAATTGPSAVYPSGTVGTGQPIYPSVVNTVRVDFGYKFRSAHTHHVQGTIQLRTLVLSKADTWQELSTVAPVTKFSGDRASVSADVSLADLYALINSVSTESGVTGTNYSLDLQPVVHVTGTVDHHPIDQTFSPVLPFAVTEGAIRVDVAVAPPPPGATFVPASATAALDSALQPSRRGTIPNTVASDITIARYHVPVPLVRYLGIAFALSALVLAIVHDRRRRRGTRRSEEETIARQADVLIIPISTFGSSSGQTLVTVPDFKDLAELARFLERPILYEVRDGNRTYAVDDEIRRYVTQAIDRRDRGSDAARRSPTPPVDAPVAAVPKRRVRRTARSEKRSTTKVVLRSGAGLLALAVLTTLTVSLTAGNNVPTSRVGASAQARQAAQLAPTNCASLAVTTMVRNSGTFSNSTSHTLILGSAGVDTITDTGAFNCIVGGGGKDNVSATTTDVCIVGPVGSSTYTKCTKKT